jgi:opacity protein-like surface antigen
MKRAALAALILAVALPAAAQSPDPAPPQPVPPTPVPQETAPPPAPKHKTNRFFVGGGVGLAFGDVDYFEISPMIGVRVIPRFDVGLQPFYRWVKDTRYSPDLETSDYGASLFARFRVISSFYVEADYQYTDYEYPTSPTTTTRSSYNAFLAGAGFYQAVGHNVGFNVGVLYDFSYDSNDPFRPYDSPWRVQAGVSVGF